VDPSEPPGCGGWAPACGGRGSAVHPRDPNLRHYAAGTRQAKKAPVGDRLTLVDREFSGRRPARTSCGRGE